MLALEHWHTNSLLVVLIVTALAIVLLRAAVYVFQRALAARDRELIRSLDRGTHEQQ